MFPIRLNMLSPAKKKHLEKMIHFQFVRSLLEVLLIVSSVIAIVLLGSQYVLQNYFSALTENIVTVNAAHAEEIREIRHVNRLLQQVSDIQKQYHSWTPLFDALFSDTPEGITLDSVTTSQADKTVTIVGTAQTREVFLEYQQQLEENKQLKDIISPISGLTQKEHIPFSISATLQ